jgi:hypothetical protein
MKGSAEADVVYRDLTNYDLCYHPKSELAFLFSWPVMMAAEGTLFSEGKKG